MEEQRRPRRFLYHFLDYRAKLQMGNGWIAVFEEYIPIQRIIDVLSTFFAVKLAVDHKSGYWILMAAGAWVAYKIIWEALRLGIGYFYHKSGMWKAEVDWNTKNKKYNTYTLEMMKTVKNIAKKVGAKDEIKEIENE